MFEMLCFKEYIYVRMYGVHDKKQTNILVHMGAINDLLMWGSLRLALIIINYALA